jgi:hypothetical protein
MPWRLKAQYQTLCVRCHNTIHPDEWIVENGGVWIHDVCPKQSAQASKRGRAKGARPVSKDNSTTQAAQQQPQYVTREQFKKVTDYVKEMAAQFNALEIRVEKLEAARHLDGENALLDRVQRLEHYEGMRQNEKVERQAKKLREQNGFAGRNAELESEAGF